jgi:putative phosphoesterase
MYIGLISDTHGLFAKEIQDFLQPVDQVWHAGDFGGGLDTAHEIAAFKPLVAVYGNCDGQDLRFEYPKNQLFNCEGMKVLMTHLGGYPGHYDSEAKRLIVKYHPDIFVCGHSHILKVMFDDEYKMMSINPGACGIMGWQIMRTALRFHIDDGKIHDMEVFEIKR